MATVAAAVLKHHLKGDGTVNIKIRVSHHRESRYLDTEHFVTRKQLTRDLKIKDLFVKKLLDKTLEEYRTVISELGPRLNFFTAETLRDYLRDKHEDIDFIRFCEEHILQLVEDKRKGTASNHRTVKNALIDFFKRDQVSISEVHSNMLLAFERFLRKERTITRINQLGKPMTSIKKGVTDSGLHNYMRDLRTLFNEACRRYNNKDLGIYRIKHYPFESYKVGSAPLTKKRNLTIDQVRLIRDCKTRPGSRAELAKDLFMLSFYLCGMNAVDFYNYLNDADPDGSRLEYNRSKTTKVRKDNAFISIRIIPEARPLLRKYIGKLSSRYSTFRELDAALSKGMKQLQKTAGIPKVTFYWARHTFANLARNKCRMSKDDVALALNHVEEGNKITDIYLEKDWSIVDEVQKAVINLLRLKSQRSRRNKSKSSVCSPQEGIKSTKTIKSCQQVRVITISLV